MAKHYHVSGIHYNNHIYSHTNKSISLCRYRITASRIFTIPLSCLSVEGTTTKALIRTHISLLHHVYAKNRTPSEGYQLSGGLLWSLFPDGCRRVSCPLQQMSYNHRVNTVNIYL